MATTIKDFCILNDIEWFPFYLDFMEGKDGKIEKTINE